MLWVLECSSVLLKKHRQDDSWTQGRIGPLREGVWVGGVHVCRSYTSQETNVPFFAHDFINLGTNGCPPLDLPCNPIEQPILLVLRNLLHQMVLVLLVLLFTQICRSGATSQSGAFCIEKNSHSNQCFIQCTRPCGLHGFFRTNIWHSFGI